MARILIAWELGSGLGHAFPLRQLADSLQGAGHVVHVMARDLVQLRRVFADSAHVLLPAPLFPGMCLPAQQMNALSDVIWCEAGGHSAATMHAGFSAWRTWFDLLQPDLLIADAAPMAIAASHGQLPSLNYDGYFHATDARAWSLFRDWERVDATAVGERASQLLIHLNSARAAADLPAVAHLHEGFSATRQVLRCLPEFDPFGPRADSVYLGQQTMAGASPPWPQMAASKKVFVYLRRDYAHAERLLGALTRLQDCAVLCVHDGIASERLPRAAHIHCTAVPVDLAQVLAVADAVVCHGGALHGLATQAGKASLLMPLHTEHYLIARMAERAGSSLLVMPPLTSTDFLSPLRRLLSEPAFASAAIAIADQHRARMPAPMMVLLSEINTLLEAS